MAAKDTDDVKTEEQEQETSLDMSQTAIKRMIADSGPLQDLRKPAKAAKGNATRQAG